MTEPESGGMTQTHQERASELRAMADKDEALPRDTLVLLDALDAKQRHVDKLTKLVEADYNTVEVANQRTRAEAPDINVGSIIACGERIVNDPGDCLSETPEKPTVHSRPSSGAIQPIAPPSHRSSLWASSAHHSS